LDKKVVVTVKSKQIVDGSEESIELVTPGKFYRKENAYYVVYDETEVSGMKGTTTTLKIDGRSVSMIRFGTVSSKLNFKKGVRDVSLYQTPYGVLELAVDPRQVAINVNEDGGEIKLAYGLESGGTKSSANELVITIR
jgi:uncharacterized beta-barrel protein YwiB (DUF1934 family)